jgi:hypothetical protein
VFPGTTGDWWIVGAESTLERGGVSDPHRAARVTAGECSHELDAREGPKARTDWGGEGCVRVTGNEPRRARESFLTRELMMGGFTRDTLFIERRGGGGSLARRGFSRFSVFGFSQTRESLASASGLRRAGSTRAQRGVVGSERLSAPTSGVSCQPSRSSASQRRSG